jgi:hypothetical protein
MICWPERTRRALRGGPSAPGGPRSSGPRPGAGIAGRGRGAPSGRRRAESDLNGIGVPGGARTEADRGPVGGIAASPAVPSLAAGDGDGWGGWHHV